MFPALLRTAFSSWSIPSLHLVSTFTNMRAEKRIFFSFFVCRLKHSDFLIPATFHKMLLLVWSSLSANTITYCFPLWNPSLASAFTFFSMLKIWSSVSRACLLTPNCWWHITTTNVAKGLAAFLPLPHITLLNYGNIFFKICTPSRSQETDKASFTSFKYGHMDCMLIPGCFCFI